MNKVINMVNDSRSNRRVGLVVGTFVVAVVFAAVGTLHQFNTSSSNTIASEINDSSSTIIATTATTTSTSSSTINTVRSNTRRILDVSAIENSNNNVINDILLPDGNTNGVGKMHKIDTHGNITIVDNISSNNTDLNPVIDNNINNNIDPSIIESMVQQLRPRDIRYVGKTNTTWDKHQFLHLHHMKTGGTSMDMLLNCAKARYIETTKNNINSMSIHECSESHYESCVHGTDKQCRTSIYEASILSYCAPLKDLRTPFGWTEVSNTKDDGVNNNNKINAITVFRHPVARAWSMYRFATKRCYLCRSLKEVYALIDNNSTEIRPMCKNQLQNHLTRNVLSNNESITDDSGRIDNAINNMKSFFTLVGLTEDMTSTSIMVGKVFPWMSRTIPNSNTVCDITRANKSPTNNRCGPNDTHMPIPDTPPDDETIQLIVQHNQLDMKLYNAAVQQFNIQKIALQL